MDAFIGSYNKLALRMIMIMTMIMIMIMIIIIIIIYHWVLIVFRAMILNFDFNFFCFLQVSFRHSLMWFRAKKICLCFSLKIAILLGSHMQGRKRETFSWDDRKIEVIEKNLIVIDRDWSFKVKSDRWLKLIELSKSQIQITLP